MSHDDAFLAALSDMTSPGGLIVDRQDMRSYLTDWRHRFHGEALCVLKPRSTTEVAGIMRVCSTSGIGVVPQGGNTGLAGGATPNPTGRQVVLSLARMDAIREVDRIGLCVEVEAGAVLHNVQTAALEANRLLPISIAAEGSATIGGLLSTNAGGVNVLRYGMTRELVLGLEVVLAACRLPDSRNPTADRGSPSDRRPWTPALSLHDRHTGAGARCRLFPSPRLSSIAPNFMISSERRRRGQPPVSGPFHRGELP